MTHQPTGTEARVCALVAQRQQLGLRKYGTTVAQNPLSLREWCRHALEEALDLSIYLARILEELDRSGPAPSGLRVAQGPSGAEGEVA